MPTFCRAPHTSLAIKRMFEPYRRIFHEFTSHPVWNLLLLVGFIVSMVDAVRRLALKNSRDLANAALTVKIASVPFVVINLVVLLGLFVVGAGMVIFGGGFLVVAGVIGSVLTYLAMLSTSVYLWAAVAQLRRERAISIGLTVLYVILSLLPFIDIAAGILVFGHSRRRPRLALTVVLLLACLVVMAAGVGLFFLYGGFDPPHIYYESSTDAALKTSFTIIIPVVMFAVGIAGVIATIIVNARPRSALRIEAQRTALQVAVAAAADQRDQISAS